MSHNPTVLPRRVFLATSCAAGCLAAAGCGASSASENKPSGPITLPVSDVPVGGGTVLAERQIVVTQPEPGVFRAFSAICTHQGCTVNLVRNGAIECPCHGSRFSITDGAVLRNPAPQPLSPRTVTRTADTLTVD